MTFENVVVPGAGDGCVDETEFYQNFGTGKDTPKFVDMVNAVDNGQTNCITKVCASERLRVCVCDVAGRSAHYCRTNASCVWE